MRSKIFLIFFIFFSLILLGENKNVLVEGMVVDKEFRIGNATVFFYNSNNNVRSVKTNIDGSFSIELPKNKYRVVAKKNGYKYLGGESFYVDYIFDQPTPLTLNMVDNNIKIYGRVFDENGNSVRKANVKIKIGENNESILTDSFGHFSFSGKPGLISIFADKNGYYGNGVSLLVQDEHYINDVSIVLEKKSFFINGTLTDGIDYFKNTEIQIVNAINNSVISTVKTNSDGIFEFRDIGYFQSAYIKVPLKKFRTENFSIENDIRQFNIFVN